MNTLNQTLPPTVRIDTESALAAFQIFLHRYSQQANIVIVSPLTQTTLAVLTSQFNPAHTFGQVVKQTRLDLEKSERIPAANLDSAAASGSPFQICAHIRTPAQPVFLTPDQFQRLGFRLALEIDCESRLATWYFQENWYSRAEIERIAVVFNNFLEQTQLAESVPCSRIPFLSPAEIQRMTVDWNRTEKPFPADATLHQLFENQVDRQPSAVALIAEDKPVTYAELETRANRLAHLLRQLGIKPGMVVGICMERGVDLVGTQLGILKSGAAYAALDPQLPKDALSRILETVQMSLLITQNVYTSRLPETKINILSLDNESLLESQPQTRPTPAAAADDPIFVLFTSGSTGLPKAVQHTHRSIVARFINTFAVGSLNSASVFAQASPLSSIDAMDEIFLPLAIGGQTVILPYAVVTDPHRLVNKLSEQRVTHILLVPSLLRVVLSVEDDLRAKLALLKTWMVGGEALTGALTRLFYEKLPAATLINFYGLTEGDATAHVAQREGHYPVNVPIGRPGINTKVYLLDEYLNPAPVGFPGEIVLSGDGLFREYLNRPELNAERWLDNPFVTADQTSYRRMFRTGDIGRYLPDGEIEYLGRSDRMVKIRGFRVELGEVESTLLRHPAAREVVVTAWAGKVARGGVMPQQRLIAYVVFHPEQSIDPQTLLAYARENLADFAVPASVIVLESFPLSPNGKVDLKALPEPNVTLQGVDENFVAPRNPVEVQLVSLWEDLLQRRAVSVNDNFFEIGGDSLAAIDLVLRIEKKYKKSLPISALLQAPTVAALAELVTAEKAQTWSSLVPIKPNGTRPPLFCVHADGGVLFYYTFAQHIQRDIPIYGLQARGLLGAQDTPLTSIESMAAHYITEIQTVQPDGPYYLCAFSAGGLVIYEMARQLQAQGEQVAFVGLLDAYGPGYPVLLPGHTMTEYKMSVHLNTLRLHNLWGQIYYLWRRARNWVGKRLEAPLGQLLVSLRLPMPHAVRYNYIAKLIDRVSEDYYTDQVYDGKVVLFRASIQPEGIIQDTSLGWGKLVTGVLKVIDVTGTHNSIMKLPHLLELVQALESHLDDLQNQKK